MTGKNVPPWKSNGHLEAVAHLNTDEYVAISNNDETAIYAVAIDKDGNLVYEKY